MPNKKLLFAFFVCLILTIVGCSNNNSATNNQETEEVDKEDNNLTLAYDATFVSLDPHDSDQNLDFSGFSTMYEGLFEFNQDMELEPVLATDYEESDDGTLYTFDLREDVEFHDGSDFDAEAAKANIDRLADSDNQLTKHSLVSMVKNTEATDTYELEIELEKPYSSFINNLAHPSLKMISPDALDEYGNDISKHPIGTGPFKFDEWEEGEHLKIDKFDDYWEEDLPKVDNITFKSVPEDQSRVNMLKTGEVDFIFPIPSNLAEDTDGEDGIDVESDTSVITWYLSMNMNKEPFDNPKVREAINYAIDKDAFLEVSQEGFGEVATSPIAPDVEYYEEQDIYNHDPEKAKELLAEAGYEEGFETKIWGANDPERIKTMEFLQAQLAEVGIEAEVDSMESGVLDDKINSVEDGENKEQDMYFAGWSPSNGTAEGLIEPLFKGDQIPPDGNNTAFYDDDEVNDLIEKAMYEEDEEISEQKFKEAQEKIWNDVPAAFLAYDATISAKRDYVEGIFYKPDGSISVKDAEIN